MLRFLSYPVWFFTYENRVHLLAVSLMDERFFLNPLRIEK